MSHFIPTLTLLAALKTACVALELSAGVKLFGEVKYYHTADILRALVDLHGVTKRTCYLVPSADLFENELAGRDLRTHCLREIVMLLTDQSVSGVAAATVGDATNPGLARIKDLVYQGLLGAQLGQSPVLVRMRPISSDSMPISLEQSKKQTGRQAWQITWQLDAGHTAVSNKP